MKKQHTNRKHNFPDADLYQLCIQTLKNAKRDLDLFDKYGYQESRMRTFFNLTEQFKELPDDEELLGDQMLMTEKKYEACEKLKSAIRSLMMRVAMKYSNKTGRYRKFGTAKMGDMTDAQLIFCGRRVVRVARQQADFLDDVGINDNTIRRITDACQKFENAVNLQHDRVANRDIAVESRVIKSNKLYEELIILCNIGKDIWAEKDPTKYEQYTIYESNNEQKKARKAKMST
jgi:hypothetical protein